MSVSSKNMPGGYRDPYKSGGNYSSDLGVPTSGQPSDIGQMLQLINALKQLGYDTETISALLDYRGDGPFSDEQFDAIFQYLLGQTATQNQRDYDLKVRDEQRNYDLPTNMLQRLMATGMSRDAAFQLMSGGSGSGGSGSLIGSGLGANGAQVSSPSGTMDLARFNSGVNAATQIVGSMCAMVNTGMSAYTAYQQGNLLKAQASLTQNQVNAYQLSGQAFNVIQEGISDGIVDNTDGMAFASVQNAQKALEDMAKAGNLRAQEMHANGSIQQLGLLSPYTSEYLSHLYQSERGAKDYAISFGNEQRKVDSLVQLQGMQTVSLAQGIKQSEAQIEEILASAEYKRESLALIDAQITLFKKQGKNLDANTLYQKALTRKQELENQLQNWQESDIAVVTSVGTGYMSGNQVYTMETISKLRSNAQATLMLESGGYWKKEVENQFMDVDNLLALAALKRFYYGNTAEFLTRATPEQLQVMALGDAYSANGVFDYMNTLINANTKSLGGTLLGTGVNAKGVDGLITNHVNSLLPH